MSLTGCPLTPPRLLTCFAQIWTPCSCDSSVDEHGPLYVPTLATVTGDFRWGAGAVSGPTGGTPGPGAAGREGPEAVPGADCSAPGCTPTDAAPGADRKGEATL